MTSGGADVWDGFGGPGAPDEWRGTGSQAEYDLAAALPLCKRCGAYAAGEDKRRAGRLTGVMP